ncbi:MAG: tRNA 2-thiocytidine(32) synthetase TtcA [Deltaproteobacteria bacterium]|nr:tRNA 2-thiocytidine(32) synthetase TtcA [Deltaproteobacteria bacterium]
MADKDRWPKVERELMRDLSRAVVGFRMIEEGDRLLVALSGGKDSYVLHHLLGNLARRAPVRFSLVAVHVDQGQPGHDPAPLVEALRARGAEVHVIRDETYPIVLQMTPPGKTCCSMCAKLRRAILYRAADELGCNKVALGHHRNDTLATLLLNLVFSGQLKAMPAKLVSRDGRHMVIRPLLYCDEEQIRQLAEHHGYPILPCGLCGSQADQQRLAMNRLLAELEQRVPGARTSMLAALANVRTTHLLDTGLWQRLGLPVAQEGRDGLEDEDVPPGLAI